MKKILTLIAILLGMVSAPKAQFIVTDSVTSGDPLKVFSTWHAKVAPTDTGVVQLLWKHCQTCIVFPGGAPIAILDSLATTTTLTVADTGWYWVREKLTVTDTAHTTSVINTLWQQVYVDLADTIPTISSVGAGVPNSTSGSQLLNINSGNTLSAITVYASAGDTTYANPFQIDVFTVTGGQQTLNYVFGNMSGGLSGYKISYKFKIENYKGMNTTSKGVFITTQTPTNSWIQQNAIPSNITDSSIYVSYQALTGGAAGVSGIHWKLASSNVWTDTISLGSFPATPNAFTVAATLTNLMADSTYKRQACLTTSFGTVCSAIETWTVPAHPANFALTTPISYFAGGSSQTIQGSVNLPKGAGTFVCALTPVSSDVSFSSFNVRTSSLMQISAPGTHTLLASFDNLVDGITYRAMFYGNDTANGYLPLGSNGPNEQVVFTFHVPADSIKPTAQLGFQYKTAHEIGVTFSGADNDSLAGFIVSDNGVGHIVSSTTGSYTFTVLAAHSSHFITLQSFDAANLYSDMDTMTIITEDTTATAPQVILTSCPGVTCLDYTGAYGSITLTGSGFTSTGTMTCQIDYATDVPLGNQPDMITPTYVDATHVIARVWKSATDVATFKVKNAGGQWSNSLSTVLQACTTGIPEVSRTDAQSGLLCNTVTSSLTVKVEEQNKGEYSIHSLTGELVKSGTLTSTTNQISITDLSNGFYTLKTLRGKSKFVKQ